MATSQRPQPSVDVSPATPASRVALTQIAARLSTIIEQAGHAEMWGVQLSGIDHVPTQIVLQKFLRANNGNVVAAQEQLAAALEWRKKMRPDLLVKQTFDDSKFDNLGFVTVHEAQNKETVITWNIYGAVKDRKATFGNVAEFIEWRVALMEIGVQKLKLSEATEPIPESGEDQYQMLQVHDYLNVSFFRMDPSVKAASKETISVFSMAYPELLAHKYFVNVPAIMGWMFGAMKLFLAPATLRKFHPMASGATLANELKSIASSLPKEYGGQGPTVKKGMTVRLGNVTKPAFGTVVTDATELMAPDAAAEKLVAEVASPRASEENIADILGLPKSDAETMAFVDEVKFTKGVKAAEGPVVTGLDVSTTSDSANDDVRPSKEIKSEAALADIEPIEEIGADNGSKPANDANPTKDQAGGNVQKSIEAAKPTGHDIKL